MLAILAAITITPVVSLTHAPVRSGTATLSSTGPHVVGKLVSDNLAFRAEQDKGRVLSDVLDLLGDKYIRELDSDKLFNGGLKALLEGLDPHTQYYSPEEAKQFRLNLKDKFGGIGVILKPETPSKYPEVTARYLGAPAARAGIQKGDLIVEVDGQSTQGLSYEKIANLLMGRLGTTVNVKVRRSDNHAAKTFSIRRGTILTSSIRGLDQTENGFWLDDNSGIGYVRISRFAEDTVPGFRSTFSKLKKKGMRALAIDLRSNFGGMLSAAVQTADIFVDSGLIVRSVGRKGEEEKWTARKGEEITMPIAVLVNEDSASASEVFTACLQDHRRAIVVGSRSFGKGSIQRLFKVGKEGAMVKMTTALYYPPSGRNIDKLNKPAGSEEWGISPDPGLEVKLDEAENEAWHKVCYDLDDHVGTDMEMPPHQWSSDRTLMAARDALRKALNIS
jgi:carboxyl-terminal processing protease